jgi:hypothetical protein
MKLRKRRVDGSTFLSIHRQVWAPKRQLSSLSPERPRTCRFLALEHASHNALLPGYPLRSVHFTIVISSPTLSLPLIVPFRSHTMSINNTPIASSSQPPTGNEQATDGGIRIRDFAVFPSTTLTQRTRPPPNLYTTLDDFFQTSVNSIPREISNQSMVCTQCPIDAEPMGGFVQIKACGDAFHVYCLAKRFNSGYAQRNRCPNCTRELFYLPRQPVTDHVSTAPWAQGIRLHTDAAPSWMQIARTDPEILTPLRCLIFPHAPGPPSCIIQIPMCGHSFHAVCLLHWIKATRMTSDSCPRCFHQLFVPI